ncbi:hypothetical protein [Thermosulfurimonas sp. F29]|uniref:hypothetical protein n=1 Tax=Thermosulfurimonas sp. F29 TaxID=2867247 RepID=UPI001C837D78|nr:hypothetical protein [Thermosulfurimonas sp. F29]MBX6423382.1 hypothetical protein [Thermosulfurimonas sp. F29]
MAVLRMLGVMFMAGVLASGCGFRQPVESPQEAVQQAMTVRLREARREGYLQGWKEGYREARREVLRILRENMQAYQAWREFERAAHRGMVVPPVIAVERVRGRLSADGREYRGPAYRVRIVRPARLVADNPWDLDKLLNPEHLEPLGVYDSRREAEAALRALRREYPSWRLTILPSATGRYWLVVRHLRAEP